ncbi:MULTISPECIES: hypothetical protein [Mycobacterium]|uniref:Uncharacterized protein n=1 Tax=Mycobacterium kiyosense TaxID=2871094 RepID=A0A9P3UZ45_9MYCO|nr:MULTISPECIES: hypothetical protein [Mycobacterium]BDE11276.1 hypothetical protein MKCMC460_01360 [Mycobacterium sp. 20KCMC460]GLB85223.1 hypothetical protein SRL2020028_44790 [Mycobacterium kiyosense]GLB91604.1 hypothetical protein SRL2020130_44210 [Mycobacterium kiyosense]GLB96882.1 hypothetical protein SRL2020226_36580 [Mycobacterium kiyosense]GLC02546.1 hypothetical protein SRL2020400_31370 [Mycobacterium kiyosense]
MTLEADPVDWLEQHDVVPLPDDDYPHAGDRDLMAGWFANPQLLGV